MIKRFFGALTMALTLLLISSKSAHAISAPHWLKAEPSGRGEVVLYWPYTEGLRNGQYNVSYGEGTVDKYGALKVGDSVDTMMRYYVHGLNPGIRYCFVVSAVKDDHAGPYSPVACTTAGTTGTSMDYPVRQKSKVTGASTKAKYQGTMLPNTGLNNPDITTGRRGVGEHNLRVVPGPHKGQITVYWNKTRYSDYHLVYTDEQGNWKYGVLSLGDTHAFTVGGLTSGVRYYFSLIPVTENQAGPHSATVSDVSW